jgi:hypothetical protein
MSELRKEVCKMKKQRKNINKDKRVCEQNQNITKQYAVSYAMLAYNYLHPDEDASELGWQMIELMRAIRPKFAVKEADKLLK